MLVSLEKIHSLHVSVPTGYKGTRWRPTIDGRLAMGLPAMLWPLIAHTRLDVRGFVNA